VQKTVLLRSRRRCCICFGLDRDTTIKVGQIAHLDRDNSNNSEENLAFLCFIHHDEYDSKTSQSKGFTSEEFIQFREELYGAIDKVLSIDVHFGAVTLPREDPMLASTSACQTKAKLQLRNLLSLRCRTVLMYIHSMQSREVHYGVLAGNMGQISARFPLSEPPKMAS
jgi:hypothetical protein